MNKLPEERKKEIIEKTKILIKEKGIDNISIRDIVKSVDMAQGLVYYYFKSKDEIVDTIINEYISILCSYILELIEKIYSTDNNLEEKIESLSQVLIDVYNNNAGPLKDIDEAKNKELYKTIVYSTIDKLAKRIEEMIKEAYTNGYINVKYPKETTYMLIYGIISLVYIQKVSDKKILASLIIQSLNIG